MIDIVRRENHPMKFQVLAAGLILAAGTALAQNTPPAGRHAPPMEMMGPGGPEIGFVHAEMMELREQIKGAPYTATVVTESTQVLSDGNHIANKHSGLVARDSEGRIRREGTMGRIGPLQVGGPNMIMIHDPVAKTATMLNPDDKTAKVMNAQGMRGLHRKMEFMHKGEPAHREMGQLKKESLGTQQIEGVTAEGTRITRTIPAGTIGNEKPIEITVETWTSTDLHVLVLSKRSDPRFGETTYKLTNIKRAEPDPTLFQVPSDFKTVHGGPETMRLRRSGPPPAAPPQQN
jgi:hypothetical protein